MVIHNFYNRVMKERIRKYYQPSPRDRDWGIYLTGCGEYTSHNLEMPEKGRELGDYALVYFIEGEGVFQGEDRTVQTWKSGDLLILTPGLWHKYESTGSGETRQIWLLFNGTYTKQLENKGFLDRKRPKLTIGNDRICRQIFERILVTAELNQSLPQIETGGEIMRLLARITTLSNSSKDPLMPSIVLDAVNLITREINSEPDFEKFSREKGVSYSHLRRLFSKWTGMALHQYINQEKINRAKLLLDSGKSVKATAIELGFSSPYYFSRLFKEKTGTAPSLWQSL